MTGCTVKIEPVKTYRIYMATIAANIATIASGTCVGWTSPVGVKMKSLDTLDSPLNSPITASEDAWISSSLALAAFVAPFGAGPLMDKIGRRWALLSSSVFFIIAYILMLTAKTVPTIVVARLIQGAGVGFGMTIIPPYVGEIASDSVRGSAGSLHQLFFTFGIVYVYSIGPYVSYNVLQYACLAVPFVFIFVFFFMPESPYYYVGKGKMPEALKSLQFLRGQSKHTVEEELSQIQKSLDEVKASSGTIMALFKNPGNRKAFFIGVGLISFQQLCGVDAVQFNAQSIFESANTNIDSALSSIFISLIQMISSALTPFIADRLGRKTILLASAVIMSFGLACVGAFFYVQIQYGDAAQLSWLPLSALIVFILGQGAGFGSVPWIIVGEIFSTETKAIAASFCASICWILVFFITYSYPILATFGLFYVFWMYAAFCLIAFFFTLFAVMETRGLSLQEIQDRLNGKKS